MGPDLLLGHMCRECLCLSFHVSVNIVCERKTAFTLGLPGLCTTPTLNSSQRDFIFS